MSYKRLLMIPALITSSAAQTMVELTTAAPLPVVSLPAAVVPPAAAAAAATVAPPSTASIVPVAVPAEVDVDKAAKTQTVSDAVATPSGAESDYSEQAKSKWYGSVHWWLMMFFGIIYKMLVVDKYPETYKANARSSELQQENEVMAMFSACGTANCLLSWFCWAPRAAHTFEKVIELNYYVGCCLMACCPCITLCYTNSCTDLNENLGGEKRNCLMAALCAWCCSCCVILQDAESLDAASGARTGCLSVDEEAGEGSSGEE